MQIVIIGSGIAGVTFAEKYRSLDADADIILVTAENEGYYSRPLLSRGFSKDTIEQSIILKPFSVLRDDGIDVISGAEITAIHRNERTVDLNGACQEKSLNYDKLILAQGSAAFVPPPLRPYAPSFHFLNSLADLKSLRKLRHGLVNQNNKPHWAIIGGGLIGCELASDLAVVGDRVTLFHAVDRLMERQLHPEDSELLLKVLQGLGIKVLFEQTVQSIVNQGEKVCIKTDIADEFDCVIVACGFKPRTEIAAQAGLSVGRGIKVNDFLQTDDEAIFALGDVAELPSGKVYAYILPIRHQANWLAAHLAGNGQNAWAPPAFSSKAKVHGFEAVHPYNL